MSHTNVWLSGQLHTSLLVMAKARFEWDTRKDEENQKKHGVSFAKAQFEFGDSNRVIAEDLSHSADEQRYYCFGWSIVA